ncbi:MAG TPA: glycosyltransferase [Opitutaceae bacterium]|nr:glycosyltransferase [Opitutaceae bacterium]
MNKTEKILSFSPFAYWKLHALYEVALCHNLKWRGHSYDYVSCDGLFSDCDIYWEATVGPRPAGFCVACQSQVKTMLKDCLIPNSWLGKYKLPDGEASARAFVNGLKDAELLDAVFKEYPVGTWVKSSVHSHLRINTVDLANPRHCAALRSYLYSGVIAINCINRMLDDLQPTIMLLFNGRMAATRIAMELAMQRGIRVVCHERGLARETLLLWENESCLALRPYGQLWEQWGNVPLARPEVAQVTQWLVDRAQGANLNWKTFSVQSSLGVVGDFLEANRGKKIWSLFTSSMDEIVTDPEYSSVFVTQYRWVEETVAFARNNPAIALVIRVHPNSGGKNSTGRNLEELNFFQQLRATLPVNAVLVMPDDKVSSYALIDRTDLGLVYGSTVALEMACRGKPVLLAARTPWMSCSSIKLLTEPETYHALLASHVSKTPDTAEVEKIAQAAYRFAYAFMHRWNIPFPLVSMPDIHNGQLAAKSLEELKPGVHACLDYCAEIVLGLRPSVPVAGAPLRKGAQQEEIEALRFGLKTLAAKPAASVEVPPPAIRASVVITCYNYGKFLRGCVRSVAQQTFKDFELIIVNDGSTDDSQKVAEACIEEFPALRITLINQPNSGQPALARNAGIRQAKGEFILPIDADDQIDPGYLAAAFKAIDANPKVDLVCADSLFDDGKKQTRTWPGPFTVKALSAGNQLVYCCVYRRKVWEQIGGYRDNVRGYEDWDFWLAVCLTGATAVAVKCVGLIYNQKDTGVYSQTVAHHQTRIAQIMLNNPAAYAREQVQQARTLIHGRDPAVQSASLAGKKVLIYSDDPGLGGAAHYNHTVLLALARAGAKVYSAQPKSESPLLLEQQQAGVSHFWISYDPVTSFVRSFTDGADAERILAEVQPDLVYFSDCCAVSNIAAKQVALKRGIPYALICHSEAGYLAERFPQVLGAVKELLAHARQVVAVSEHSREVLRKNFNLPPDKGTVIYSGRPARYFAAPNAATRERLRAELGIPADGVLCFTAARLDSAKGFQFQLEAIRQLHGAQRLGPLYFAWAGEGDVRAQLEKIVEQNQLQSRVRFLGYRWDIADLMDASDAFVLTSISEALPLCLMEAMAKGLPVASCAVGGIPEELGNTGALLSDPNVDPKRTVLELTKTLEQWAGNADLRKKVGETGRERARAMFREEVMIEKTLAVLTVAAGETALKSTIGPGASTAAASGNDRLQEFQQVISATEGLLQNGQFDEAIARMERALQIAPTAECVTRATEILEMLRTAKQEQTSAAASQAGATSASEEIFGAEEVQNVQQMIATYGGNPADPVREQLLELQQGLMNFLVTAETDKLAGLFQGNFGEVFRALVKSGLSSEPPTEDVQAQAAILDEALGLAVSSATAFDYRPLMARMLRVPAHRGSVTIAPEKIPAWFLGDYLGYVLHAPQVFVTGGEAEQYHAHLLAWARAISQRTRTAPHEKLTMTIAHFFAMKANYIPLYFSNRNTREAAEKRAGIMEFVLLKNGAAIDARLPKRPKNRTRIKVGYLSAHFGAQTETHVTLPTLQLDRSKFEICLFALASAGGAIEDRCRSFADSFTTLSQNIHQQVKTLRDAALDVIIIGTNVTAVTNAVSLIALHRLAPLQLASYCSPVSTGMRHIDGYLTGTFNDFPGVQEHFSEKLHFCEGPPGCLDYTVEAKASSGGFSRAKLGIAEDEVVFVNAAACFKILPEMQETWAKILKTVPKSRLLLLPFNPNWSSAFPVKQFERTLAEACERHGVSRDRFIMADSLPSRADVKALESVADVYLDTFPFSGSISVIDPLELGIPVVGWQAETHRSRMAASLLRELGLPELITENEAAYVALSVRLATDAAYRRQLNERIRTAMARGPKFVNAAAYAQGLGRLLESLVSGEKTPPPRLSEPVPELAHT